MAYRYELAEAFRIPDDLVEECPSDWPKGWCEERLGEPILVLATRLNRRPRSRSLWHVIQHQTAGNACRHHRFWAMRLTPTADVFAGMIRLEAEWFESNVGWHDYPILSAALAYRDSLRQIFGAGFDCDQSYAWLNEAIYPIDCSRELLARICTDALPSTFGDYFEDAEYPYDVLDGFDRAELYILGANSD